MSRFQSLALHRADAGLRSPGVLLWAVAGFAAALGLAIGISGGTARMDAELVPLLRFMAVLKAAMAVGAACLVQWRLRRVAEWPLVAALLGSTSLMMVAPGLIWGLNNLILGAVLFHVGLIVFVVVAARDGLGGRGASVPASSRIFPRA